jgi:hypothetical protein
MGLMNGLTSRGFGGTLIASGLFFLKPALPVRGIVDLSAALPLISRIISPPPCKIDALTL